MALVAASLLFLGIFFIAWLMLDIVERIGERHPIRSRSLIVGAALFLALFVGLSLLVSTSNARLDHLDRETWEWTVSHRDPGAAPLFVALSSLISDGVTTALVLGIAALLLLKRMFSLASWLVLTSLGALLHEPIKAIFGRSRPPETLALWSADSTAFPSAHAFSATIVFGAFAVVAWRTFESPVVRTGLASLAAATAAGVGISRIWLAVHWFSDVIAGWSLGLTWLLLMIAVGRCLSGRKAESAPPGRFST